MDYDKYSSERNPKPVFSNNVILQEYFVKFKILHFFKITFTVLVYISVSQLSVSVTACIYMCLIAIGKLTFINAKNLICLHFTDDN